MSGISISPLAGLQMHIDRVFGSKIPLRDMYLKEAFAYVKANGKALARQDTRGMIEELTVLIRDENIGLLDGTCIVAMLSGFDLMTSKEQQRLNALLAKEQRPVG